MEYFRARTKYFFYTAPLTGVKPIYKTVLYPIEKPYVFPADGFLDTAPRPRIQFALTYDMREEAGGWAGSR